MNDNAEQSNPSTGSRPLTIAIDYDDTFDAAALMWTEFVKTATRHGHKVVCITARRKTFDNQKELRDTLPEEVEAHFSYDEPKADYAKRHGIAVDIWIDDRPGWIVGIT